MKNIKKYLGIDWGSKRIGLAIAESSSNTAVPLSVAKNLKAVLRVIKEEEISELVIGQPTKMSGDSENLTPAYLEFMKDLKRLTNLPINTIDERLTSKAADQLPGEKSDKAQRDTIAAMIILQSYLDRKAFFANEK